MSFVHRFSTLSLTAITTGCMVVGTNYTDASALVVTYLLNNEDSTNNIAELWETQFLNIVSKPYEGITIAYSAEVLIRSLCLQTCFSVQFNRN